MHKFTSIVLLASSFISLPAIAAPILWDKVEAGMSKSDVEILYPEIKGKVKRKEGTTEIKNVVITGNCLAEVNLFYPSGSITKVVIKGNGSIGGRCSDTVLTALSGKYGQPLDREETANSILAREGKIYVWSRPGVTMRFKRFTNGAFGGGGLAAASWELTYTTISDDIAL